MAHFETFEMEEYNKFPFLTKHFPLIPLWRIFLLLSRLLLQAIQIEIEDREIGG